MIVNDEFRILVVDDNRSLAEALSDVFEAKGYQPTLAFDGVQAVEKARSQHFDCILMDIKMPRMSGVDAFKEIKKFAPSTPVILMTAYSVQGLIDEAKSEGVLAILQKPVAPNKLFSIVEELKGKSSLLIADPNPEPTLIDLLTAQGDRAIVATSARIAMNMAAGGNYDAVLLNAEIHGITSHDSIALFSQCDPKCLIILMSGERAEDYSPLIFGSLQKPFKIQDVVSMLERVRARKVQDKLGKRLFEI
jgi:two-component system, NtrC family, response regulator HydG